MGICDDLIHGRTLIEGKKYREAEILLNGVIESLEKSVESERDDRLSEAYNYLGFLLYKKVEFIKAEACYSKSIEFNPTFAPAYYNRGIISYRLGSFLSANKDFKKAVQLNPNEEFSAALKDCSEQLDGN